MKIDYCSDLHIDFGDLILNPTPGAKVLILAGDVCEAIHVKNNYDPNGIMFTGRPDLRPDRFMRFFLEECSKYEHVFYVMGNHEYYGGYLNKTIPHLRSILPKNIHILDREVFFLDGVAFLGGTMWTDFGNANPINMHIAKHSMYDYNSITMFNNQNNAYHKLTPEKILEEHRMTKQFFEYVLKEHRDSKVVSITHHAPSSISVEKSYKTHALTPCYYSDLSDVMLHNENLKFWIHGHIHTQSDYMIGETRVLANPRGYVGYENHIVNTFQLKSFEV